MIAVMFVNVDIIEKIVKNITISFLTYFAFSIVSF